MGKAVNKTRALEKYLKDNGKSLNKVLKEGLVRLEQVEGQDDVVFAENGWNLPDLAQPDLETLPVPAAPTGINWGALLQPLIGKTYTSLNKNQQEQLLQWALFQAGVLDEFGVVNNPFS